jgi:hypothetical protein
MKRAAAWVGRNVDGVVPLVAAIVLVVLDVFSDVADDYVDSGILVVLGALTLAMLRDRNRQDTSVGEVTRTLKDLSMVRVLTWSEVTATLAEARRVTDRWVFRGGTGTYMRARTLPDCIAHARADRRPLMLRLEIIDPTDVEVCGSYASLADDETDWTLERTQRESYATIVACCWYWQRYELLDIRIGLSRVMPTLRWDLSSAGVLITQGDPRRPNIFVERGKLLYDYLYTELRTSLQQVRLLPLERARDIELGDPPTLDEVRRLLEVLDVPLPNTFTDTDVADVIKRALHAENRYDP